MCKKIHESERSYRRTQLSRCGVALIAISLLAAWATSLHADTVLTGRIVYGTVLDDIGEVFSPNGYLQYGAPIPYVTVGVRNGLFGVGSMEDETITDENGYFRLTVTGTPSKLSLVAEAQNAYVKVKKHKAIPLPTDATISTERSIDVAQIDYNADENDLGDVVMASDLLDVWTWYDVIAWPPMPRIKCYASRAFYIATAVRASGSNLEDELGYKFPGATPEVRYGTNATPYYLQLGRIMHITNTRTVDIWHEYGHFFEDAVAEFALIPPYFSHGRCSEITDSFSSDPNLCWGWFEGLADWIGTVNAVAYYGDYATANAAMADSNGWGYYSLENLTSDLCGASEINSWSDPRAVENVVAEVLWDLVDDDQDPPNGSLVDEVAQVPVGDVLRVITEELVRGMDSTPCSGWENNSKLAGLDQFWDMWREMFDGVVPDLYAAYAFNGVAMDNAVDLGDPAPVGLVSATHPVDGWSNFPEVDLVIYRGDDDVSGSYEYFVEVDMIPDSLVPTEGAPEALSIEAEVAVSVPVEEGKGHYVHCNTLDMARHPGKTTHYGPFHVDLTPPYFTAPPVPEPDQVFLIGQTMDIAWASADDLSGIDRVTIEFRDPKNGVSVSVLESPLAVGEFVWFLDPAELYETSHGAIVITAWDVAGNSWAESVPVELQPHFFAIVGFSDWDYARVVSGDLTGNGRDEVVVAGGFGGQPRLDVYYYNRTLGQMVAGQTQNPGMFIDDLVLVDVDGDESLDVVAVSQPSWLGGSAINVFTNNGPGGAPLVNALLMRPVGVNINEITVRVLDADLDGSSEAYVFGRETGVPAPMPIARVFSVPGFWLSPATPIPDAFFGDWESDDMNLDGHLDFVALGTDAGGSSSLTVFWGSGSGWTREDIEPLASALGADVDLGDFNADGFPDVLAMFAPGLTSRRCLLLENLDKRGFAVVAEAEQDGLAYGDGKIVDMAGDGLGDVLALGLDEKDEPGSWFVTNSTHFERVCQVPPRILSKLIYTDTAWGDFDADGDLDAFIAGYNPKRTRVEFHEQYNLTADYIHVNAAPPPPTNLSAVYDAARGGYVFSWSPPEYVDDVTPSEGLGYELRVGTTGKGSQVMTWEHPAGPSEQGAALHRFVQLAPGTYYYDVRSVDSGWLRSLPAGEMLTSP